MRIRMRVLFSFVLCACLASANNKKKDSLPPEILNAQTVVVLVDPDAVIEGMDSSLHFLKARNA